MRLICVFEFLLQYLKKTLIVVVLGLVTIFFILNVTEWFCPEFNGSCSLGNNIYMLDWDGGGRIIVRGTSINGKTCYGGEYLVPSGENHYDSIGNVAEYVIDARSNDNWIIAKTVTQNSFQRKYYIIDKRNISDTMTAEEIINTRIECFSDTINFSQKCIINEIKLTW